MIEFTVDQQESRLVRPEQVLLIPTAADWDERHLTETSNIYIEPITRTLMLRPLPLTQEWQTTASGSFARLRLSDTNRAAHASWSEFQRGFAGNYYLHSATLADNHADRLISTINEYPKNQPFFVSFWSYNYGGDRQERLECGWTTPGSGVSLRVWSDRQVDIYKGTEYLDTVSVSSPEETRSRAGTDYTLQNQQADLLLIPCRRRSLLIITNFGGNAVYEFDDLSSEEPDNEITPPGSFWVKIPHGTITIQFAPCRFRTAGLVFGAVQEFRYPPATGSSATVNVYYDPPGYGTSAVSGKLYFADGSGEFVPDDTETQARIRLQLTGDGSCTNFVYGASAVFERETAETADEPVEVGDKIDWSVGENGDDVSLTVEGRDWSALETIVNRWRDLSNRSCRLVLDEKQVFTGRTLPVHWTESAVALGDAWRLTCRDRWHALARQQIRDTIPLDGLELSAAIRRLALAAGLTDDDLDLTATDFNLPTVSASSRGEWSVLPRVGESYADAILALWRDYARTWTIGFVPTATGYKLRFAPPADEPYAIACKLYLSATDAIAGGVAETDIWKHTLRQRPDLETIAPECNEIVITGWDPVRRVPFQRTYRDVDSQDPTLPPGSRPSNWLGEPVVVGVIDYTITTTAAADRMLEILAARLTQPRKRLRATANLQWSEQTGYPLWRGEIVHIVSRGLWQVRGFHCELRYESEEAKNYRKTVYEFEQVSEDEPEE